MEVIHDVEKQKFYVIVNKLESHLEYVRVGNVLNLNHTYVPIELRGKGIAAELVKSALSYVEENKLKIIPTCSYVAVYVQRHIKYDSLVVDH